MIDANIVPANPGFPTSAPADRGAADASGTDALSVDALYDRHYRWLCDWLRRKLACADDVADMAQEIFLRVIASGCALAEVREPRAYLVVIAKRLLIDQSRRRQVEQCGQCELACHAQAAGHAPSPEHLLFARQALARVGAALQALPSHAARDAFLMHCVGGQTYPCIAAQLGKSTRTVQKYIVQAQACCRRADAD